MWNSLSYIKLSFTSKISLASDNIKLLCYTKLQDDHNANPLWPELYNTAHYCIYTLYLNTFFNLYLITVFKYF